MIPRHSRARLAADHPLLEGLNEEDLTIAHGYHDAETVVRQIAAKLLLGQQPDADNGRALAFVRRLQQLSPVWWPIFEDLIGAAERGDAPNDNAT